MRKTSAMPYCIANIQPATPVEQVKLKIERDQPKLHKMINLVLRNLDTSDAEG